MNNKEYHNPEWEMKVPHNGSFIGFIKPVNGEYIELKKELANRVLRIPSFSEVISLIHFCTDNLNFKPASALAYDMNKRGSFSLIADTGFLYGDEGVYIQDYPIACWDGWGNLDMDESELVKKLETGDKNVRFVPFSSCQKRFYNPETHTQIARHPLLIGAAGEEGAEKIAQIVEKYKKGSNFVQREWEGREGIAEVGSGWGGQKFFISLGTPAYNHKGDTYLVAP